MIRHFILKGIRDLDHIAEHAVIFDFQIFDGTIRENILFDRNVPDDEIMMALEKENLSCLVRDSARRLLWN